MPLKIEDLKPGMILRRDLDPKHSEIFEVRLVGSCTVLGLLLRIDKSRLVEFNADAEVWSGFLNEWQLIYAPVPPAPPAPPEAA